ncbi:MAG: SLBB domain-containing protein [Elusimicrobia bacterium]|nr:SLBB domain-containing protein [Candidatus Obscuribacterium magneticum]
MKTRCLLSLILSCLLISSEFQPLRAQSPSDLKKDLAYYKKVGIQKKMSPNDRLFVLLRIREKYENAGVNLNPLDKEIARIKSLRDSSPAPIPASTVDKPKPPVFADIPKTLSILQSIYREETADGVRLVLELNSPVIPKALRVEDPKQPQNPLLIIDLPDTTESLSNISKQLNWNSGPLSQVTASQEDPKSVRIQLELRGQPAYKVVRTGNLICVEFTSSLETGPAVEPEQTSDVETTADSSYRIQPGDLLNIQISPAEELSRELVVQSDDSIVLPLVGTLETKNLTAPLLSKAIMQRLKPYVSKPQVNVSIKQFSNRNIFIMGQVKSPGPQLFRNGLRLLSAISAAGGFTEQSNRNEIKIYRGRGDEKKSFTINAQETLSQGDLSKDFSLMAGDIIEVLKGGDTIFIIGQVTTPGHYEHRENITLLELISEAGGVTPSAKMKQVKIFRQQASRRKVLPVNLDHIMKGHPEDDIPLEAGDIIMVPQKSTYASSSWMTSVFMPWAYLITVIMTVVIATR